jgi:hypothetical protein
MWLPSSGLDKYHHGQKNGEKRNLTEKGVASILHWSESQYYAGIRGIAEVSMKIMASRARQSLTTLPVNSQ